MPGPKLAPLVLTGGERSALTALARKREASQALAGRAKIVLACTRRKLRRSAHRTVTELEAGIRTGVNERNKDPRPFTWTKAADEILGTLAACCQRISGTGEPA